MKKRLLYITAFSLKQFGGAVRNGIEKYEHQGIEVDLLTLYSFPGQKSNQFSVFSRTREMRIADFRHKVASIPLFKRIYNIIHKSTTTISQPSRYLRKGNNTVVLEDESKPIVSNDLILSKITKNYDYFLLYGWQDMMSSSTVEAIYDRYHKPIIISCPDMYQLTGNCFYTAGCEKYKDECRNCHVFAEMPNKGQAHQNFLFKKRVYKKTGCYIVANSHQKNYFLKSGIIDEDHILLNIATTNTDLFRPLNRDDCRKRFGLGYDKFYLFLRYINPHTSEYRRKGLHLLEEALEIVFSRLSEEEKEKVEVMFAGISNESCEVRYAFKTIAIGYLDLENLIKAYNAASVFVCPSVDDAGPTMVSQSIACGTPVVAFNQGIALDVIEDGYNGFKAPVGDVEGFAQCIESMLRLSSSDYTKMRGNARVIALNKTSYEANYKRIDERFLYIDKHFKG